MSHMQLTSRAAGWPPLHYCIKCRRKMKMNLYLNAFCYSELQALLLKCSKFKWWC